MLMEGIHFDLVYTPLRHLGYKAAMVNLSDIYAMNGTPRQLLVSVAVSNRFEVEDLEELYAGLRLACKRHGVDLVGGDTSASLTGIAISITAIGTAKPAHIAKRSGAKPTDLVCVSGNFGAAYMGLQLMEREKAIYLSQVKAAKTQFPTRFFWTRISPRTFAQTRSAPRCGGKPSQSGHRTHSYDRCERWHQ